MVRKLTLGAFIAALLFGGVAAFAPLASTGSSSATVSGAGVVQTTSITTSVSLVSSQGLWILAVIAVPIAVTLLPVLVPRRAARITAATLLWIGCLLGALSIGLFFVPSAVLMTIASTMHDRRPAPAPA